MSETTITPEYRMRWLRRCWELSNGKAWEPPAPNHQLIIDAIHEGYLRRTDGRVGFELLKDAMVAWTDAGRAVMNASDPGVLITREQSEGMLEAARLFTDGCYSARDILNSAGLPCPASLARAAEKARNIVAEIETALAKKNA